MRRVLGGLVLRAVQLAQPCLHRVRQAVRPALRDARPQKSGETAGLCVGRLDDEQSVVVGKVFVDGGRVLAESDDEGVGWRVGEHA